MCTRRHTGHVPVDGIAPTEGHQGAILALHDARMDAGDGAAGVLPGLAAVLGNVERGSGLPVRPGVAAKQDAPVHRDDGSGDDLVANAMFGFDEFVIAPGGIQMVPDAKPQREILPFSSITDSLEMQHASIFQGQQGRSGHIPVGDLAERKGRRPRSK